MHSHFVRRTAVCLAIGVMAAASLVARDILTDLGIPAAAAKEQVMTGVGSGWLDYGLVAPAFKRAPAAVRAELAGGAVAWAKAYTATPEFTAAYGKLRENRRPRAPEFKGTPEEEQAAQLAKQAKEQAKGAEEMKKALAQMPPEQRKQLEEAMAQGAAIAKQMDTPEMRKMALDGIRMQRQDQTRRYEEALKKWQEEYPENPAPVIAKRLRQFLETSGSVDFQAKLEPRNGKMRFANPEYEGKPSEWKLCYRAGKEAVDGARAAARAWLKELGQ